jgi:hypothetical protein
MVTYAYVLRTKKKVMTGWGSGEKRILARLTSHCDIIKRQTERQKVMKRERLPVGEEE